MCAIGRGDAREAVQAIGHHGGAGHQMALRPGRQHCLAKPGHGIHPHGDRVTRAIALYRGHKRGLAGAAASRATPVAFAAPVRVVDLHDAAERLIAIALNHRLVLYRKAARGRKDRNLKGGVVRSSMSRKCAAREREPWLLVASPSLGLAPRQLVTLYARRMQIESSFRDLKSHRYGQGFEDSLTRFGKRIEILLLVHALAAFASWLAGLACEATGIAHWLSPIHATRRLYSTLRVGREALVRDWPIDRTTPWLERLRSLPPNVLEQMQVPV